MLCPICAESAPDVSYHISQLHVTPLMDDGRWAARCPLCHKTIGGTINYEPLADALGWNYKNDAEDRGRQGMKEHLDEHHFRDKA